MTALVPSQPTISNIHRITYQIDQSSTVRDELYTGNLGVALYYFYLSQLAYHPEAKVKSEEVIEPVLTKLSNGQSKLTRYIALSRGLAGLAWCLHILYAEGWMQYDVPSWVRPIDRSISRVILHYIEQGDLDFMHSSIGALAYLTDRLDSSPELESTLEACALALHERFTRCGNNEYIRNEYMHKRYQTSHPHDVNLSLSHGLCSILLVLLQMYEKGISQAAIADMVEQSITFIKSRLRIRNFAENRLSAFPSNIVTTLPDDHQQNQAFYTQRMGWCYGDLNQVLLLYKAGNIFNREDWIDTADQIGSFTLQRCSYENTGINDAYLCHGTSGVAQFYKALYRVSGKQQYILQYHYWLQQTNERLDRAFTSNETTNYASGFLEGLSGVGLVLLSQTSEISQWEKLMLLY